MKELNKRFIRSKLKKRKNFSDKGDFGHALIIAGQKGYMCAAVIASKACLRTGVGLVIVSVPDNERSIIQTAAPEAILIMRDNIEYDMDKYSAVGIGPDLGTDRTSEELLDRILSLFGRPILVDADALNMISSHHELLEKIPPNTIITPHQGEFDRLFGSHQNNEERIKTARQIAKEHRFIIVLKGHHTAIITSNDIFYNTTGNTGLAKGGSGDALTGVITSFLAQGYTPLIAAMIGVYLHGLASDITLKKQSMETMLITDVIKSFGEAFKKIRG